MHRILILLVGLLLPGSGWAAISCGTVTPFNDATPTNPETIAYTTPAGTNQVLFVGVASRGTVITIVGASHAGNAMTPIDTASFLSPIGVRMFYLVNPASGINNVSVGFSATPLSDAVVIWTCSGVDTSSPLRAIASATGTGTAVSVTVSGVQSGDVVLDMFGSDVQTTDPTVGANQTVLNRGNDGGELGWGASQQPGANGGVMSWTTALSQEWASQSVAIKALGATPTRRHEGVTLP